MQVSRHVLIIKQKNLGVAMNMVMSDSSNTLAKYIDKDRLFAAVYDLAVDKLTDKDHVFNIRDYFKV